MKTQHKTLLWAVLAPVIVWTSCGAAMLAQSSKKPLVGYNVITVDKFNIEQTEKTLGFSPRMLKSFRSDVIDRLDAERVFDEVIDGTAIVEASPEEKQLRLSATVIKFKKGSRAKRALVPFGAAGSSELRVRFVLRDAKTGTELLRTERKGKFSGWFSQSGGSQEHAMEEAAGDVVDGLIKDIKKNR